LGVYDVEWRQDRKNGKFPVHAMHSQIVCGQYGGGVIGGRRSFAAATAATAAGAEEKKRDQ
jgi:hypothetical protein